MKAHTSFTLQRTTAQRQQMEVWRNLQRACWTLNRNFGFGEKRMKQFLVCFGDATKEIAEIEQGNVRNKTWQDELDWWSIRNVGDWDRVCFDKPTEIFLQLCCFALNRNFKFGRKRLSAFVREYYYADRHIAAITLRNGSWREFLWKWADAYGLNEAVEKGGAE